jgi:site-specific DNA-methyltransferase (adenine-specific)
MSNPRLFRYDWVWDKVLATGHLSVGHRPLNQHESIVLFSRGAHTYNPQRIARPIARIRGARATRTDDIYGDYNRPPERQEYYSPKTILRFSNPNTRSKRHSSEKPLALLDYLIRTYTNPGDTVLDFCYGSGTTGHACANLDRSFVGIEKDASYYAAGAERIALAYEPLRAMQEAS